MNELSFRGKDRYRPSWPHLAVLIAVFALQGFLAATKLGPVGTAWLLGGTAVLAALGFWVTLRCWTTVGPAGITICWGFGRGRTYPWQEIRWIDVRETKAQGGSNILTARMFLAGGRRRGLPALQHSDTYPSPDFEVDVQRVVNWWELSTDPTTRIRPPKQFRDRITPTVAGILVGLLISAVGLLAVLANA
ncbi:hypothetical protein [Kitasatospora sp. NPDC093806]|uniref:hypothetical protein n=1 Tax=Kitasatospora sp. NPDC093806 TaxID=3155075 RepID=UPI00342E7041